MENNPSARDWPNLGSQPDVQPKRNNFPKVQNRTGRPNISKKQQPADKKEAVQRIAKTQMSTDPDLDVTPPTEVIEPNESNHTENLTKLQAEIDAGEKRLVRCMFKPVQGSAHYAFDQVDL
jgi:hypothetical protein